MWAAENEILCFWGYVDINIDSQGAVSYSIVCSNSQLDRFMIEDIGMVIVNRVIDIRESLLKPDYEFDYYGKTKESYLDVWANKALLGEQEV